MKKDAAVLALDGKHVGRVESMIAEPLLGQIMYLVVSSGIFAWTNKLVPIRWVKNIGEESVLLRVDRSVIENLVEEPVAG